MVPGPARVRSCDLDGDRVGTGLGDPFVAARRRFWREPGTSSSRAGLDDRNARVDLTLPRSLRSRCGRVSRECSARPSWASQASPSTRSSRPATSSRTSSSDWGSATVGLPGARTASRPIRCAASANVNVRVLCRADTECETCGPGARRDWLRHLWRRPLLDRRHDHGRRTRARRETRHMLDPRAWIPHLPRVLRHAGTLAGAPFASGRLREALATELAVSGGSECPSKSPGSN